MISQRHRITDRRLFARVMNDVQAVFDLTNPFPLWPCRWQGGEVAYFDYYHAVSDGFWPDLQALASIHGDNTIEIVEVDPDPEIFFEQYGTFTAFGVPTTSGRKNYTAVQSIGPTGSDFDALMYKSDTWVCVGPSRSWGVWNDYSFGLSIVFSRGPEKMGGGGLRSLKQALSIDEAADVMADRLVSPAVRSESVATFRSEFGFSQV